MKWVLNIDPDLKTNALSTRDYNFAVNLLIYRFIYKAQWLPNHTELTCLLWVKRKSRVCGSWFLPLCHALTVLWKEELQRQLDLLKRQAFKNAKQTGMKGKVQFWSNPPYYLTPQDKLCCFLFLPMTIIPNEACDAQESVALIRTGKLNVQPKGKWINH